MIERTPVSFNKLKGLNLDQTARSAGCLKCAINVNVLPDRSLINRRGHRIVVTGADTNTSRIRGSFEFRKDDGTKIMFFDSDHSYYESTATAPAAKPTGSQVTIGGDASAIASADFIIGTKELYYVKSYRWSSGYEEKGCDSSLWADTSLSFYVEVDSVETALDPLTKETTPTIKISDDNGSTFYRENIALVREESTSNKFYAYIGKCSKMDYKDLVLEFNRSRDFYVGEVWTFTMNPYDEDNTFVDEDNITHTYLDDLTSGGTYTGVDDLSVMIKITTAAGTDKFSYSTDNGENWSAEVAITGAAQTITDGITATFGAKTGHLLDTYWRIEATPADFPIITGMVGYYTYIKKDSDGIVLWETDPSPVETLNITVEGDGVNLAYAASADSDVTHIRLYRGLYKDLTDIRMVKDVSNATSNSDLDLTDDEIENNPEMVTDRTADPKTRVLASTNTTTGTYLSFGTWYAKAVNLDNSDDSAPCWIRAADRAYRADGENPNMVFKDMATPWHPMGITPPDEPATENTYDGPYRWYYIYIREETDRVTYSNPSPVSYSGEISATIHIKPSTEYGVNKVKVFRSLADQPDACRLIAELDNVYASHTYSYTDAQIRDLEALEFDNYKPYRCKFLKIANGYMNFLNITEDTEVDSGSKSWLMQSKVNEYEHMQLDYHQFDPKDGDEITGCAGPLDNQLLVFKNWKTFLFDPVSLQKDLIYPKLGCASFKSIQEVGSSAIWLSHEGFVVYSGQAKLTNISKAEVGSDGEILRGGINSAVLPYIDSDYPDFISTAYYGTERQFHAHLKNKDDITDQRYFVFHLDSGQWTEYEFYDNSGNRVYVHHISIVTDADLKENIVIFMENETTNNIVDISQFDWDPIRIGVTEILTQDGDGVTKYDDYSHDYSPSMFAVDNDCNFYSAVRNIYSEGPALYKTSRADISVECLITPATFLSETSIVSGYNCNLLNMVLDKENEYFYFIIHDAGTGEEKIWRCDIDGDNWVLVKVGSDICAATLPQLLGLLIDTLGNIYFYYDNNATTEPPKIMRISDPGGGSQSETIIHTATSTSYDIDSMDYVIEESNGEHCLFFIEENLTGSPYIHKFRLRANVDGAPYTVYDMLTKTDTYQYSNGKIHKLNLWGDFSVEFYYQVFADGVTYCIGKSVPEDITFASSTDTTFYTMWPNAYCNYDLKQNGRFIVSGEIMIDTDQSEYLLIDIESGEVLRSLFGYSSFNDWGFVECISFHLEDDYIIVGNGANNVGSQRNVFIYPLHDVAAFVENFENGGDVNYYGVKGEVIIYGPMDGRDKGFREAYITTDSECPVCGVLSVVPDDKTSETIHNPNESSVPDGAYCASAFQNAGVQEWQLTDLFEKDIVKLGTKVKHRLNLTGVGDEFLIGIEFGNLSPISKGQIRISNLNVLMQDLGY